MAVATFRSWSVWAITISRTFLATTLLVSASVGVSHLTFHAELVSGFELLLGAAIAAGWLMRYAAILVVLGTIAARVLAPHLELALLPANTGTAAAALIASGILICFGQSTGKDAASIADNNKSFSEHSCGAPHEPWDEDIEVAIRLEDGHLGSLWKRRCIVTIHDRAGGVLNTGHEFWYSRDDHRRC